MSPLCASDDPVSAREFMEADIAEDTQPPTPLVYWFANGEIWSGLGGAHPLSVGGAMLTLDDLARRADPTSRLYWPNACHDLHAQLAGAVSAYRKHWQSQREHAQ